jgi:hypothetical protein
VKIGDLYRKIGSNEKVAAFLDRVGYFVGNFWPYITGLALLTSLIYFRIAYNRRFNSNEIVKFVKDSRHAGNAIFINKGFLITNYKSIATACRVTRFGESVRAFIIFNGEAIKVDIVDMDKDSGLVLLRIDPNEKHYVTVNNFALFPNVSGSDYKYMNSDVFISKMINDPESDFYDHYKITGITTGGYTVRSKDVLRKNFGEAVLNERLELIGLTDGNSANGKIGFLKNEIRIIEQGRIKNFLKKHNIRYYKNLRSVDLRDFQKYAGDINAELICYVKEPKPQRVIKRYR